MPILRRDFALTGASPPLEGILHIPGERQDGQLRDPLHPLRPLKGGLIVPRNMIREFDVPYLKVKRGKGSPNYRLAAAGAHQ